MMRKLFVMAVASLGLLCGSSSLHAQRAKPQEIYKILGISVEGNHVADAGAILASSGLKVGDEIVFPGDRISDAIRKLWALRLFGDVQIAIDRKVGDGAYLLIKVAEFPRFDRLEIKGNDEINSDKIEKKVNFIRGQVLPPQELLRIEKAIRKLYEEEGYLLAEVKAATVPIDTAKNRVILTLTIDEGNDVRVRNIMFEGNKTFDGGDLRGEMKETVQKRWWKIFTSARFDRKKYEEDKKLIIQFYKKNGYRDSQILGDSIWYSEDKRDMNILIRLYEGAQYKIRTITWEGNTVYPDTVLNERLSMFRGDVYDQEKFEQNLRGNEAQSDVASLYLDNGYLTFNLEPEEDRVPPDSVDIHIKVYERNKFVIGHVNIKGNTKTYEKVIRRELYTRPGDFFSRAAITRSLRQLQQLNYFNPERLKPDVNPLPDGKTVDVSYEVEEKSSDNVNASIGYSGAFGVTGAIGFTINNFSLSEPLSGGGGQILNFEAQFGEGSRYRTFSVGFTEPWLFDTPTLLGISLYWTKQDYISTVTQKGGSLRIGRRFKWPDDYFRGDWIITAQRLDVENDPRGYNLLGASTQVSVTQIISRNSTDNPIFPSQGSNVSLSMQMSGGPLLPGNIDFHKWMVQADWYMPMFNSSRVALFFGNQYGFVSGFRSDAKIPGIDLFYMGGTALGYISTTPLRGYDDQSIGPRNAYGGIVGGKVMAKNTAELRFSVSMNPIPIYLLGFAEAGNVFESFAKANLFDLKRSAGFGARLLINPIGMIGFDYGYGFDHVTSMNGGPDGWRFHFVFGKGF